MTKIYHLDIKAKEKIIFGGKKLLCQVFDRKTLYQKKMKSHT